VVSRFFQDRFPLLCYVLVENGAFLKLTIEPRSGPPWKRTCPIFLLDFRYMSEIQNEAMISD